MGELQKQAALLRAEIEEAFADVVYPGDENLYDGRQRDDDYEDVARRFTGKHWKDLIPKRKPSQGRTNSLSKDMNFCSVAAWHFFLPAYLITDLMMNRIDIYDFQPPRSERYERRFSRLNTTQCAVLVSFFGYASELLDERQKKSPHHSDYFERERHELSAVMTYWSRKAKYL